jgi:flagellar biosynthesis protein FliP
VIAFSLLRTAAALAITLGLIALAFRLLRRFQASVTTERGGLPLRVLQRVAIGPKQGMTLVRVGGRVLVLAVGDGGAELVTELSGEELSAALREDVSRETALPAAPPWLATALDRVLPGLVTLPQRGLERLRRGARIARVAGPLALLVALALAPALARAQSRPAAGARPAATQPARPRTPAPAAPRSTTAPLRTGAPAPSPAAASGGAASAAPGFAVLGPSAPQVDVRIGEGKEALHLNGAIGLVVLVGVLTLLPALFLLMTSFTRILIVLHFLRSALGTQTVPPGQLLVAMAVLLTGVVMNPVLQEANTNALQPYMQGHITQSEAYARSLRPFRAFMLDNTREKDLAMFTELAGAQNAESIEQVPVTVVVSAFMTSELRTAFQMGFAIFLPFVVVDLLISSVLMSLGMFMLPPMMISLPFKLLLFVLADGWTLVVQNLVTSFR